MSQGAEGDKVVPDDEAVDSGDTDASGENQQVCWHFYCVSASLLLLSSNSDF